MNAKRHQVTEEYRSVSSQVCDMHSTLPPGGSRGTGGKGFTAIVLRKNPAADRDRSNSHEFGNKRSSRRRRKGLTLFELLLALAIFLASLAALAQLLDSGSRAAAQAKLQTEAILRCESKLGEMVAGITPIEEVTNETFDDDPRWSWQSTVTPGPWPNLQLVELSVSHRGQSALGNSSFSLRRYVRDPRLFVNSPASRQNRAGRPTRPGRATPSQPAPSQPAPSRPAGGAPNTNAAEDSDG